MESFSDTDNLKFFFANNKKLKFEWINFQLPSIFYLRRKSVVT